MSYAAFGTVFKWNSNAVGKLTAINGIELSVDTQDVTTHQSTDNFKESIPGLIDAGEVSLEGLFNPADTDGQVAMLTDLQARVTRACAIEFPAITGAVWSFNGFITNLKIGDAAVDGTIAFSATVKVTGKPTLGITASAGLSNMVLSNSAVVTPAFGAAVYDYVATVLTGVASLTVTPTAAAGVITVNGVVVATGQASGAITLGAAGSVTTITIVVTETNKAPKTYTVRVARAAS